MMIGRGTSMIEIDDTSNEFVDFGNCYCCSKRIEHFLSMDLSINTKKVGFLKSKRFCNLICLWTWCNLMMESQVEKKEFVPTFEEKIEENSEKSENSNRNREESLFRRPNSPVTGDPTRL